MPSEPAVLADGAGDELVGDFGHRLEPAGNQLPSAADHQPTAVSATATEHVERRVREGDRSVADMADREEGLDVELMKSGRFSSARALVPPAQVARQSNFKCRDFPSAFSVCPRLRLQISPR